MVHLLMIVITLLIVFTIPSVWHKTGFLRYVVALATDPMIKQRLASDHRYKCLISQAQTLLNKTTSLTIPAALAGLSATAGLWTSFGAELDVDDTHLLMSTAIIAFALAHLWTLTPPPRALYDWLISLEIEKNTIILEKVNERLGQLGTEINDLEQANGDPAKIAELTDQLAHVAAAGIAAKGEIDRLQTQKTA